MTDDSRPYLILDVDHTLIQTQKRSITNNERISLVDKGESKIVLSSHRSISTNPVPQAHQKSQIEVFDFKFRPKLHEFLREACKMFNIILYTMSMRYYGEAIVDLIDPTGTLLRKQRPHLVCRDDIPNHTEKSLLNLSLPPHAYASLIILDDRLDIWAEADRRYVLQITPYFYFNNDTIHRLSTEDDGLPQALISFKLVQRYQFQKVLSHCSFLILDFNVSVHLPSLNALYFDHTAHSKAFQNWTYLMRYLGATILFFSQFIDRGSTILVDQFDYDRLPAGITHVISLQPHRVIDCLFYRQLAKRLYPALIVPLPNNSITLTRPFHKKRKAAALAGFL